MKFYSTNRKAAKVGLKEAVMQGLAPDGGLYMPSKIPHIPLETFGNLVPKQLTLPGVALEIAKEFFLPDISENSLEQMIHEALGFPVPLHKIEENIYSLELYHGPTGAFKDIAAQCMSRLMGRLAENFEKKLTILTATSGDTGGAVAQGFFEVPNVEVIILYPSGKVSELQEKQITGMGKNIVALEVAGTFDDCQKLAKQAFQDEELQSFMHLGSANSINIARLLPQTFYYWYAALQLQALGKPLVFSVPSGNFGNLTAGIIAQKMGAPIAHFVASTNINDAVPHYLQSGLYQPKPSQRTISNAMDVGAPSNFDRMLELFGQDVTKMREVITGASFSDTATRAAIKEVFQRHNYTLDPHGAVGYLGLQEFMQKRSGYVGVFLETAHPAKFAQEVEACMGQKVSLPEQLRNCLQWQKQAIPMANSLNQLRAFLQKRAAQ